MSGLEFDDAANHRGQDFMCMARSERESSCLADRNDGTASLGIDCVRATRRERID
jgi:hypothetical protein